MSPGVALTGGLTHQQWACYRDRPEIPRDVFVEVMRHEKDLKDLKTLFGLLREE